jgi:quercetin dioxygenase-like cupin family protein
MIVKRAQGLKRSYMGINFQVLAVGKDTMITKMQYAPGDRVAEHGHPNEQSGYVLSGRIRLRFLDFDEELEPGDSYTIPAGTPHSMEVIEPGDVIDVFTPPREEYR